MIYLAQDEEQEAVAEMTRELGLEVLYPVARDVEAESAVPAKTWKAVVETGLTAPVSEELGGGGIPSAVTYMTAVENLAYGDAGITLAAVWSGAPSLLLSRHGTPQHQAGVLGASQDLDNRGSVALYEGFGRGASELETTIVDEGENVRVVGRKVGVPFSGQAESIIVVGVDPSTRALRAVIVPRTADGVSVGVRDKSLALDAADLASIDFDVLVPRANLLGSEGLQKSVEWLRLAVASAQTGMAQRAMEYAAEYAKNRVAFGKPIASFQGISFPLAEAFFRTEQARLEVLEAASLMDNDGDIERISAVTSSAVAYASENASESTRHAVQVLGGHGFIREYPVELWYRTAATLSTLDFDPSASSFHAVV
ncbi:acyl-CoA dehydrogenase family protein [Gordonia polyisoprenivorans]|uniref:acyl-CoA dehydrogenase family protein n=1 Tax=Gordonia polyisoprenivorans TaxID=84595 RepID=UPI001AD7DF4F|nr:acyl-CoA dehydrogenase family protein [Gordonia polyisoprenivorans]QTI69922.1 acyl-CoA dehydrogenase family protein [Gordonia polyisoprenivorans]